MFLYLKSSICLCTCNLWCGVLSKEKLLNLCMHAWLIDFFPRYLPGAVLHILRARSNSKIVLRNKLLQGDSDKRRTNDNQIFNAVILNQCPFWEIKINFGGKKVCGNNCASKPEDIGTGWLGLLFSLKQNCVTALKSETMAPVNTGFLRALPKVLISTVHLAGFHAVWYLLGPITATSENILIIFDSFALLGKCNHLEWADNTWGAAERAVFPQPGEEISKGWSISFLQFL